MTCAMEVANFISFPSIVPMNMSNGNLDTRYYSLFGNYPSNYYGYSLSPNSSRERSSEVILDENKENDEKVAQNTCFLSLSTPFKCHENICLSTAQYQSSQKCSIIPSQAAAFPSSFIPNNCNCIAFQRSTDNFEGKYLTKCNDNGNIIFEMNEGASTSCYFPVHKIVIEEKNHQSVSKPSHILPLTPKPFYHRLPPQPGWDEKLIQRIESFRSLRNIQDKISRFKRQYRKGFRYRSKQRVPLRIQLLKYKCLNSIYGDLEVILGVKKCMNKTE